ncbi:MAG: radical SAM protein [Candidatus Aegiribacteria sp.]|nr:radical SAM protein [Candidatus Aegiribacteria sp.]
MDYSPVTAVWEITMCCNMRCGHCGSACADALPDELTTEEALAVIDQMKTLGIQWITLSGGEPLTRKDWPALAGRLTKNGIVPNIITNGWLLTEEMVRTAQASGVQTISISLDGVKDTHDAIRTQGSFDRVINSFRILRRCNHISAANTTITKQNLDQLDEIKSILIENHVDLWQLQIGLPMGNMADKKDLIVGPETIEYLLDYSYQTMQEGKIRVFPADCLGYFTTKEMLVRQVSVGSTTPVIWQGCNAGKRSFGLLHNGDVTGCTSIRDPEFIEGNILDRSLVDIWNDPEAFKWSRSMTKSDLSGNCRECLYGTVCLGGCPNTRLTLNGCLESDNTYCAYHAAMEETKERLRLHDDVDELNQAAWAYVREDKWQLASLTLQRALEVEPDDTDTLSLYGYASFILENFETARDANEKILTIQPDTVYAMKGLGLSLYRLGDIDAGLRYLIQASESSTPEAMNASYDLATVYRELGLHAKADEAVQKARLKAAEIQRVVTGNGVQDK